MPTKADGGEREHAQSGSLPIGLRQCLALERAVAVAELGLAVVERLADAVDPHRLGAGR